MNRFKQAKSILTLHEEECLVRYLKNKNRACQSVTEYQPSQVVLALLKHRKKANKGAVHARDALQNNRVGRPGIKLHSWSGRAVEYLESLAAKLNEIGIRLLEQAEPGVWNEIFSLYGASKIRSFCLVKL